MGQITSGVGLISGLPIADLVDQLIAIEARPKQLIEQRNAVLTATQVAYQSINAQLLGLKGAASGIISNRIFDETTAISSDEAVIAASSSNTAVPGNYSFTVKQLVSSQQTISRGFADTDASFLGPGELRFDRGLSRVDSRTLLSELNGGDGVRRGYFRITDRSGNVGIIDLTDSVTVEDAVNAINNSLDVSVIATVTGDGLTVTDNSGSTANDLVIADIGLNQTATGLGIAGSSATGTITGSTVNFVGENTLLARVNDGNAIRNLGGQSDFQITDGSGTSFAVSIDEQVTIEDVIDSINEGAATAGATVTASVVAGSAGILLTDAGGGGPTFAVTALNGSLAAADLGILQDDADADGQIVGQRILSAINSKLTRFLKGGLGIVGEVGDPAPLSGSTLLADLLNGAGITTNGKPNKADIELTDRNLDDYEVEVDGLVTVQDLIDAFNAATGGAVVLSIEGQSLRATDTTGGTGNLLIADEKDSDVVLELGIEIDSPVDSVLGSDTQPIYSSATTQFQITDRAGASDTVDITATDSVSDIIAAINASATAVTASLNRAGNGILLTDTSGGSLDLVVADTAGIAASLLGLAGTHTEDEVDGFDLDVQYLTEARRFEDLGIARGQFLISDSSGATATVDLTQGNEVTIADVLAEINSRGLQLNARLNDSGDGIVIEDLGPGTVAIKVEESGASTAADLGILGEAETAGADLVGSFEKVITIEATDTLSAVRDKINDADVGASAAIINDGSIGALSGLSLSASQTGSGGAFVFDDGGLGFDAVNLAEGEDAITFFGGGDPADALVITSTTNTLNSLIPGATINLLTTSDNPVQVTISRDEQAIIDGVQQFVDSFNGLMGSIDEQDSFNAETEERGLLLGDPTVNSVKQTIFNAVINRTPDLTGTFSSLSQVGIKVGSARLTFDQGAFTAALDADRDAVEDLFTLRLTEEDENGDDVVTARGVGVLIDDLLARLTNAEFGPIQARVDGIDQQLALNARRIEALDLALESRRERLQAEFVAMERALADLQNQSSALASFQPVSFNFRNNSNSN